MKLGRTIVLCVYYLLSTKVKPSTTPISNGTVPQIIIVYISRVHLVTASASSSLPTDAPIPSLVKTNQDEASAVPIVDKCVLLKSILDSKFCTRIQRFKVLV